MAECHIHKLRHKSVKSSGTGLGGAGSIEDLSTAHTLLKVPSSSSLTADSDNDSPSKLSSGRPHQETSNETTAAAKPHLSTDSEPLSDDSIVAPPPLVGKKSVAINTSQVEQFSHRLLPVQSPEFDNVIDQVFFTQHLQYIIVC